jgi:hypothetical protein
VHGSIFAAVLNGRHLTIRFVAPDGKAGYYVSGSR